MSKGKIIYFDGPDGVGKTTQLKLMADELAKQGHKVHVTPILGGSELGDKLREVMLSDAPRPVESDFHMALACYYASAGGLLERRQTGDIVLVDRSPLSMIAYQVYGDGLDKKLVYEAVNSILTETHPDLLLTYHADASTLQERRRARRNKAGDYFEHKPLDYHARVAVGFKEASKEFKATAINASGEEDHVFASTMPHVLSVLDKPA